MTETKAQVVTDIKMQLAAIAALQPSARLETLVKVASEFSPEEFSAALPSIQMGPEGPILARVMLVSESYLVDLHLTSADLEFDFALRSAVKNYRVALGEVTVKVKEEDRNYQTARINLLYLASLPLHAELTYVGTDRAAWLAQVKEALPVQSLLSED